MLSADVEIPKLYKCLHTNNTRCIKSEIVSLPDYILDGAQKRVRGPVFDPTVKAPQSITHRTRRRALGRAHASTSWSVLNFALSRNGKETFKIMLDPLKLELVGLWHMPNHPWRFHQNPFIICEMSCEQTGKHNILGGANKDTRYILGPMCLHFSKH